MRSCSRPLAALLLALVLAACRSGSGSARTAQELDALFSGLHRRGLFEGAVVVGRGEAIVWEGGYGFADAERGVRFTPDTPSDGASIAKTFTAALVLELVEEGQMDLDAPLQRVLPEIPYEEITLRHLLSHSSGLPADYGYFDAHLATDAVRTTETLLRVIADQRPALAFRPGSAFEYNSFGFDLAALAAARVSGMELADLLRVRLFQPAGMRSAFLRPGRLSEFPSVRTRGYRLRGDVRELHEVFDLEAFHGGSNVYVSARDLHRWNTALLRGSVFHAATRSRTMEPARPGGGVSGLSLGSWYRSADGTRAWYSGHLQGFHCEAFRDHRRGESIAYVSNNTLDPWLQKAVVRAVSDILAGRPVQTLLPPPLMALPADGEPGVDGEWRLDDGSTLTLRTAGGRTSVTTAGVVYAAVPVGPTLLYVPGLDPMIGFERDPQGRSVERMHVSANDGVRLGARVEGTKK